MSKEGNLHKQEKGFTIIEVLIVLTIIGLILAIILASISVVKQRSRDFERKSIVNGIAIEMQNQLQIAGLKRYPRDSQRVQMCDMIRAAATAYVGQILTCGTTFTNHNGENCVFATTSRGFDICWQEQAYHGTPHHLYRGPKDEITIASAHWCVRPGRYAYPGDDVNGAVITSENHSGPNYRILSVRTELESGGNYCTDNGLVQLY